MKEEAKKRGWRETIRPHFSKIMMVLMLAMFGLSSFAPGGALVSSSEAAPPMACTQSGEDDVTGDPCLYLTSETLTEGLFSGANIIIIALGAIMFLLAGMMLGGNILTSIVGIITRFKFSI